MSCVCVAVDCRETSAPASISMLLPLGNSMSVASACPMATKVMRMPLGLVNACGAMAKAPTTIDRAMAGIMAR